MRLMMLALMLPLVACEAGAADNGAGIPGTGSGDQRSYAVRDIAGVTLSGSDEVRVHVGSGYAVTAHGAERDLATLVIDRRGDTLTIGYRPGQGPHHAVTVDVTMPRLASAHVGGSGTVAVDRAAGTAFAGSVGGSGSLTIAALTVRHADLSVGGSGSIRAAGRVDDLAIDVSGSGQVDATRVAAHHAGVSMKGSGSIRATATADAAISMAGSGSITIGGNPNCTTSRTGSGTVRCGG